MKGAVLFVLACGVTLSISDTIQAAERPHFCQRDAFADDRKFYQVSGRMFEQPFFGPPYWGERPKEDAKEFAIILKLDDPLHVDRPPGEFHDAGPLWCGRFRSMSS